MKTNTIRSQRTGDMTKNAPRHVRPKLTWALLGSLGLYAGILLDPAAQRWALEHQFGVVKAAGVALGPYAVPLLWVAAVLVGAMAVMEATGTTRRLSGWARRTGRPSLRAEQRGARLAPGILSRLLSSGLR